MTFGPGSLVNGKYRLGRLLGEGGMGTIYEARHEFLGTEVALKFLHPALSSRPNVVARFVQEARVSANIKSPHVVTVIDVDQSPEGLAFLVMELLHGEPLSTRLAREPVLSLPLSVAISLQVLLALDVAHGLGVVHRDMKPENVFLTEAPGNAAANRDGLLVKILDFGIAKLRTLGEVRAQLTKPGMVMGTPEYMAPEQVYAADAVDARADLYAVGAMLFEMLSGRRPVQGDDPRGIAAAVMTGQTPRLETLAPRVPSSIADVVAIALAAKPDDRFSSANAMRQALANAAREASLDIDLPAPQRRKTQGPANTPNESPMLGTVGLGVAPQAMLGPGDPGAMHAFDQRSLAGNAVPAEVKRDVRSAATPAPLAGAQPSPPLVSPSAQSEPRVRVDTLDEAPRPLHSSPNQTIAAAPTPYAPPVAPAMSVGIAPAAAPIASPLGSGPQPIIAAPIPATPPSHIASPPAAVAPNAGETAAGFVPPFALGAAGNAAGPHDALPSPSPLTTPADTERGAGTAYWPYALMGLVVLLVGAVIFVAVRGSFGPPAPAAPSASTDAVTAKPKPKHDDDEDDDTSKRGKPKPSASASTAASASTPKPKTTVTAPKPSVSVPTIPSLPIPLPSTSGHPLPSPSRSGDIIEIPLPWPVP